jgi:radical SAM protein with 4Fe4S-binding SPASM domain
MLNNGTMEWELFQRIASGLAMEYQASTLVFALHNEPLLDKRLFNWVTYTKAKSPKTHCIVVTNGELLDRFSLAEILHSGLDQLIVSLNAHTRETYERINTSLDYERVVRNIHYLLSDQETKPKLELRFALITENAHEVKQALDYWKTQGVRTKVRGITNRGGSFDNFETIKPKNANDAGNVLHATWKCLTSIARSFAGCELPFYQMNVLFNGEVVICCHDWNRTTVVGNVKTSSLREIWNSVRIYEIRRLTMRKRYEEINSCKNCSPSQMNGPNTTVLFG